MSSEELRRVRVAAEKHGLTMSEYVRIRCGLHQAPKHTQVQQPQADPRVDRLEERVGRLEELAGL